jgi:integrase/recombinase XerD
MKSNENTDDILKRYKQYLRLEKSLSTHTVDAYFRDLEKLLDFLKETNVHYIDVELSHLETFSASLRDLGICPRSQARILSGIRSFYHFLVLEDHLKADPCELLESPQTGFHLPEVLTIDEIDNLIGSIDLSTREGQRNRAILETLYSCGLRVSELCNLKLSNLYLEEGFSSQVRHDHGHGHRHPFGGMYPDADPAASRALAEGHRSDFRIMIYLFMRHGID